MTSPIYNRRVLVTGASGFIGSALCRRLVALGADVHAASLHPDWTHTCVPSKAVTTICLGRPLLFAGDPRSDTAMMLDRAAWTLSVPRDGKYDLSLIRSILDEIADPENRARKTCEAKLLADALRANKERSLKEIADLIVGTSGQHQRP